MTNSESKIAAALVVSAIAFIGAGVASMDVHPKERVNVPVKVQDTKTIYKTRTVKVNVPPKKPSGYIARDQCYKISNGTNFSDLIFRYGWPADDNGDDSYAGVLLYPLAEDHDKFCSVSFFRGEVERVSVDLQ